MTNYAKKAARGIAAATSIGFFAMIASYAFQVLLARGLSQTSFGLFSSVFSLMVVVHTFHDPGFKAALIKMIPEYLVRKDVPGLNRLVSTTLTAWIALSGLYSVVLILLSSVLATYYFKVPESAVLIVLLAISFVLNSFDYLIGYVFQGFQRMGLYASVDLSRSVLLFALTLCGLWILPGSPVVPATVYILVSIILTVAYLPLLKRVFPEGKIMPVLDSKILKHMFFFGMPFTLVYLFYGFFQKLSVLFLTAFSSYIDVAFFNVAIPVTGLMLNATAAIAAVLYPLTSELWTRGLHEKLGKGVAFVYKYSIMAAVPLTLVFVMFASLFLRLLFGESYVGAAPALIVLACGSFFWVLANITFHVLAGIGKTMETLKIMLGIGVLNIVLHAILVPVFGLLGAVISLSTTYVLTMLISILVLKKYAPIGLGLLFWVKTFFAGALFAGILALAKFILVLQNAYANALLAIIVASVIYGLLLIGLKLVNIAELLSLRRSMFR